jgi:hypothetical protein
MYGWIDGFTDTMPNPGKNAISHPLATRRFTEECPQNKVQGEKDKRGKTKTKAEVFRMGRRFDLVDQAGQGWLDGWLVRIIVDSLRVNFCQINLSSWPCCRYLCCNSLNIMEYHYCLSPSSFQGPFFIREQEIF